MSTALPKLEEDHHGVIPYAGNSLTLYSIEAELSELLALRDTAEADGALPEEIQAIDQQIAAYVHRELRKVDGIARAIHVYEDAAQSALEEAVRIMARAKSLQANADRIKANALRVMQMFQVKRLETPTNRLRVCGNGGKEPLEVSDVKQLALRYLKRTITLDGPMTALLILMLERCSVEFQEDSRSAALALTDALDKPGEPDNDAIRAALKLQVPCPECKGRGRDVENDSTAPCVRCNGSGMVPNAVPGARLLPRGEHLRVE